MSDIERVRITFEYGGNEEELVIPLQCTFTWALDNNLAFKKAIVVGKAKKGFKYLLDELNNNGRMLVAIYFNDKLFIKSWVTIGMLNYYIDASQAVNVNFVIFDRFVGLKTSHVVKALPKENSSLELFISQVLQELKFDSPEFINTYPRKISSAKDFILRGAGITGNEVIKTFKKEKLDYDSAISVLGNSLSNSKAILSSNGYDTLTLEVGNPELPPIDIVDTTIAGNMSTTISKTGMVNTEEGQPSATSIILNSQDDGDNNNSVVVNIKSGLPNTKKVKTVSLQATYRQIKSMLDYNLAGIKARQNSFLIKCKSRFLTTELEFFQPNRKVTVYCPELGISEDMVILQMGCNIDSNGIELTLNVSAQDTFDNNSKLNQKLSLM
jgi:hypothetical protein